MPPLHPRERDEPPPKRPRQEFSLPYPRARKPIEREKDPDFDPFEFIPRPYQPPKLSLRPSNLPPRSTRYEIVDRVTGADGLPLYILREVTEENETLKLEKKRDEVNGDHGGQTDEREKDEIAATDETIAQLDPAEFLRRGLLKTGKPPKGIPQYLRSSTPQSSSNQFTSGAASDYGMDVIEIPYTKILQYVSPLQLERFEHFRFENPTADDLPWLTPTPSVVSGSPRSMRVEQRVRMPVGRPPKKRKLDHPMVVVPGTGVSLMGSSAGTPASTSLDAVDEDDEDRTITLPKVNGNQQLVSNIASALSNRKGYGMVDRRPRSLRESTAASSSTDPLPRPENGINKRNSLGAGTSGAAPSSKLSNPADPIKRRRRRKRDPLNALKPKPKNKDRQKAYSKTPSEERPPVDGDEGEQIYEVNRILGHDYVNDVKYYQVSWVGYPETAQHLSWLMEEELAGAPRVLRQYQRSLGIDVGESEEDDEDEDQKAAEEENRDDVADAQQIREILEGKRSA